MSQSKITINSVDYNLSVTGCSDDFSPNIVEKQTVIDPDDYDATNSVLIATGYKRHIISIKGYCSTSNRINFRQACDNNTKVYPFIYPGGGTSNIADTSAYYYITALSGDFKIGSDYYWFSMTLKYGGV